MNQAERRMYLIKRLIDEKTEYKNIEIPATSNEQKELLRALMNVRLPAQIDDEFLIVQDEYLKNEINDKGIVDISALESVENNIYLWKGDITLLKVDAIVNAANSAMTGCYHPLHNCIDNCIHTYAGVQLRNYCNNLMQKQGYEEPTGQAKITPAFNLPSKYVIHTVGPIVNGHLTQKHCDLLASCYASCIELADKNNCESIAFCCISTGVFGFPKEKAAEIAIATINEYIVKTNSKIKVVFNVFKDDDFALYNKKLRLL